VTFMVVRLISFPVAAMRISSPAESCVGLEVSSDSLQRTLIRCSSPRVDLSQARLRISARARLESIRLYSHRIEDRLRIACLGLR